MANIPLGAVRSSGSAQAWRVFRGDLEAFVHVPFDLDARAWRHVGYAAIVVAASSILDERVRRRTEDGKPDGADPASRALRPLGQGGGLVLVGLTYLAGRSLHRPEWTALARDAAEASLLTGALVVPVVKLAVGRARPNAGRGSSSFQPFGGDVSFPSGEAAEVFALASVFSSHTKKTWAKVVAWSAAAIVAYQRVELDGHWVSDVVAGALVGGSIGRWVVRRHRPDGEEIALMASPVSTRGKGFGMGLRIAW